MHLLISWLVLDPGNFFLHGRVGSFIPNRFYPFLELSYLGGGLEGGRLTDLPACDCDCDHDSDLSRGVSSMDVAHLVMDPSNFCLHGRVGPSILNRSC